MTAHALLNIYDHNDYSYSILHRDKKMKRLAYITNV